MFQVQREAVGRDDVEADAGEQHDPARFRLYVPRLNGLVEATDSPTGKNTTATVATTAPLRTVLASARFRC